MSPPKNSEEVGKNDVEAYCAPRQGEDERVEARKEEPAEEKEEPVEEKEELAEKEGPAEEKEEPAEEKEEPAEKEEEEKPPAGVLEVFLDPYEGEE